ncbi:unnamed protein product [Blepharisma stoltei]|uniref:Uncharacterized protein n=1 Tax=Blepharisma stoltei TaxID=1481888 RepID=A0AAU9J744_9CILI|nr:unnamed protein product [Blepharisma stoltei]
MFFDGRICVCLLPENVLFCYGGTKAWAELIEITCLINEKLEIQMLSSGLPALGCIASYYQNFVYVFGTAFARKFNLNKRKWEKLILIPDFYRLCSCITFNDFSLASEYDSQKICW